MTVFANLVPEAQPHARRLTADTSGSAKSVLDQGIPLRTSVQRLRPSQVPARRGATQAKLAINKPGDEYEQEADRISEQVMRMPEPQFRPGCDCGGSSAGCQTAPAQEQAHLKTMRVGSNGLERSAMEPVVHDALRSPGQPLDAATRGMMEPRFGRDFSQVRVHTDVRAADSAQVLGALAYTTGRNVVFGAQRYAPETVEGQRLIAHELAHVVQQSASRGLSAASPVGSGSAREISTVMRQPEPKSPQQPQQAGGSTVASLSLREIQEENPSADEIKKTREYVAYMDPDLIWQRKFRARPDEALEACRMILYHIKRGERVDWYTEARYFLLNARELLHPQAVDKTPPPKLVAKHHYRVELKAWIPHAQVIDPTPSVTDSHYRGDDHRGYDGTWRVLNWAEFDWDGKKISGFHGSDSYGTTHRDYKGLVWGGTESATATCCTGRDINTDRYFTMWISSKNPIPLVPVPAIDSTVDVIVGCDSISFVYTTDEFPSHGIRVFQDGKAVETKIVFDASTIDGTDGLEIFYGLTSFDNKGDFDVAVPPDLEACQSDVQPPATVSP